MISLDSEFGMNTRGFQEVHVNQVVFQAVNAVIKSESYESAG